MESATKIQEELVTQRKTYTKPSLTRLDKVTALVKLRAAAQAGNANAQQMLDLVEK